MIKRRFYRQDHRDQSDVSSSSSSEDDQEVELQGEEDEDGEEEEEEEEVDTEDLDEEDGAIFRTSGYFDEGSSADDNTAGSPDEDDAGTGKPAPKDRKLTTKAKVNRVGTARTEESEKPPFDPVKSLIGEDSNSILKIKSVFKCRICPRVVCLSETFLMAHLKSKRHARSKKLQKEGRLKLTLNSDGELEEEKETHAERHARIVALSQSTRASKKSQGRQRQARRRKRKLEREAKRKKTE